MEEISYDKYKKWKKKRSRTIVFFFWMNFIDGIASTAIMSTVLLYLEYDIKTTDVNKFYALIITAGSLSSAIAGVLVGKYVDETRKIKYSLNVLMVVQFTGYVLYTIPCTPYFAILGRLLSGVGECFTSVSVSEIIRICDGKMTNQLMCWMPGLFAFGASIGPLVILPFENVDFNIGPVNITKNNIVGIIMAMVACVSFVLCQVVVYDCSQTLDLKEKMGLFKVKDEIQFENCLDNFQIKSKNLHSQIEQTDAKSRRKNNGNHLISTRKFLSAISTNFDILFIYFCAFFFMYMIISAEVLLPIINYSILGWNLHDYSLVTALYGVLMVTLSAISSKVCTTQSSIYILGMWSLSFGMLFFLCLQILGNVTKSTKVNVILMVIFISSTVFMWFFEVVVQRNILANLIPSKLQGVTEALRNCSARVGMILGSLITPLCVHMLEPLAMGILLVLFTIIVVYSIRIKYLWNPKMIILS